MFTNMELPKKYNVKKVLNAVIELHKRAIKKHGNTISFCGHETCWANCCNSLKNDNGTFFIILLYNVNKKTLSTYDNFDIS